MHWLHFPPFLMLAAFAPAAIAYRYIDAGSRPPFLVYATRWFLGLLFVISGLAKLIPHFPNSMGPTNLEFTLEPHGLVLFARFIAVAEVATGLLLLTRRFAFLGALLLVPMLTSIIVITTSLQWQGTPYLVSGFLVLTLGLLAYDYPRLLALIDDQPTRERPRLQRLVVPGAWVGALSLVMAGLGAVRLSSNTSPGVWLVLVLLVGLVIVDWRRPG